MAIQRSLLDCFATLAMTILLFIAAPAAAQNFPANNGSPVVDQAGILTPAQVVDLRSKAEALYAQSGRAFAVATVRSLEGYPIEDYGYRLGRYWKLGSAKKDDGVLLLVAPNERKVTIATGYGAGEYMTDAMSGLIIREAILPHFKQSPPDYGGGVEAGADAIIKQMNLPADQALRNTTAAQQAQRQRRDATPGALPVIFWIFIIGFVILSFARRAGGRRYRQRRGRGAPVILWGPGWGSGGGSSWSGGSSWGGAGDSWGGGGSFGGFGGGSFGGGGASGSW